MRGLMKNKFSRLHPALFIASVSSVVLVGGWLFLRRFQIDVEISSPSENTVPVIQTAPTNPPQLAPKANPVEEIAKPDPVLVAVRQGSLRVRNRSSHSLRVALLSRQPKDSNAKAGATQTGFALPAHWDFAPSEGSDRGLLVSLPNREVRLKRGDVVVAFAQDGSQRYWGPFVVGETDRPQWNEQTGEWELILDE